MFAALIARAPIVRLKSGAFRAVYSRRGVSLDEMLAVIKSGLTAST